MTFNFASCYWCIIVLCSVCSCVQQVRSILRWIPGYPDREGRCPSGRADVSEPGGPGRIPRLGSRRSSLISIEHAELLRSTPSLVLCCAWLVTMALHVHCGLGQLSPSGDDKWVAAKHCGRAKRSRISDTHQLRSSFQLSRVRLGGRRSSGCITGGSHVCGVFGR